jgi:hypothetical protein
VNRVAPIFGLASHLGRGVQRIATDAIVGRVRSLPRTVADLNASALSEIMGCTVTSVAVIGGDAGTTSRARLALTGIDSSRDVPESVFVKMPGETVATRLMGELGRLAETETRFYSQLAPDLTGVPKPYGSAFDPLTGRFVLVLEDLAVDTCEFPDTLHPLDKGKARLIVELLARVHATFWGRFIDDNYRAVARLIDAPPHTVMPGDAHPGNVYFRNGAAGLLDWQAGRPVRLRRCADHRRNGVACRPRTSRWRA